MTTPNSAHGPKVLLVNDDSAELSALVQGLRSEGIDAVGSKTPSEALQMLRESRFDAALIDLMIPDVNGLDMARRLRLKHPEVTTILMSDYLLSPVQLAKANTGVVGFVPKPCRFEEMAAFIRNKTEKNYFRGEASTSRDRSTVDSHTPFDVLSVQFSY